MLNIFGVVIFLRTGWVVVCVSLFIYMFIYLFYFFLIHACSWYRCKSFALSIKWSDFIKSFLVFAFLSQMNSFARKERGFVRPHFYFFYYYIILILFHVLMYMYSTVRGVCMHADSKINFTSASLIKLCSAHPL